MEKINPNFEKTLAFMIYGSLMVLALGLLTSTTLLALSHIFILVPGLYFLSKTNFKALPKSAWALLAMTIVIMLSVLVNQDIATKGYKPIFKAKYFLVGFISLAPFGWYFKNYYNEKKISYLLYVLCISTTVATIAGLIGLWTGINPILMKVAHPNRNSGLFGMLMNYAHNLSFFLIILTGLVLYRDQVKKYINIKFVILVLIVNLIGFYFTYTRGAWLGFLAAVPFFFFKEHKKIFIGILSGFVLLGVLTYFVAGNMVIRPQSEIERISQWEAALMAFKERPILGYGYLNFETHSGEIKQRYDLPAKNFVGHAHNNFFEMMASTGALGLITFVLWIGFWFKEMYERTDFVARIGLAFIVVFVVDGLTQSTISLGINLFFIIGGYVVLQINREKDYLVK